ncbi:MAG TPA: adenylate/guanylate cyclase domain-containing protein [Bryobacteraceae bacterium]|nr:adenylate/guanylate cyclase domain-containing protein [Bryobacteraceae bacterium]
MAMAQKRQPRRVQYRVGLGVTVSLLVAGAIGLVAWASLANTRDAIVELTDQQVRELLTGLDARVGDHLQSAVAAVQLSEKLLSTAVLSDQPGVLARHFTEVLRANPTFAWASYSDTAGNFTGAYRAPGGSLHLSQTSLKNAAPNGAWERHYEQSANDYDPRDEEFYQAARQTRKLVWVGPVIFYDEGLPGITCANPRFSQDGALLGVLTVDFNLNFLSDFIEQLHFGQHGKVFMFDQDHHVIAFPGLRLIENAGHGAAGKLLTEADLPDPVFQAFIARHEALAEEQFVISQAGQSYIAGYRRLHVAGGPTWYLGAYAPESDFLGVLTRNRLAALAVATAALCIGLLVTMTLARRISVPLTRLASEMEEVGNFQLNIRQPMDTIFKEVATMDDSLLSMKKSLRSFSYYVPRDLVRAMLESGHEATLQGQTREMTVYFSDIAGMTSIAESMAPDQLVELLSRYFDEMTRLVAAQGGTVDKFIGDAIMAFWGAPAPTADHAARACETALRSQRKLAELRAAGQASGLAKIRARIGIATGDVLVGNVGSHDRFNYTVMGDTVNLASRLESLNKLYGTQILISDPAYQQAQSAIVARPVGVVQVKGKSQWVRVWEPLCLASDEDDAARELARLFAQGLAAYMAQDFRGAAEQYKAALRLCPEDQPAAVLLDRCREYLTTPPPEGWAGVYVATEK